MVGLDQVKDRASAQNIEEITQRFVEHLSPLKIFLFGSFADGSYTDQSDYDFYIVVNDQVNPQETRKMARRAIRYVQKRPVDIVVGTNSRFEKYGTSDDTLFIEGEVFKKGRLLYDQSRDNLFQRSTL
ncbi:MAG: nucleotidyltransferase domain-containing protein [Oscillospiraceae bacterium]|nr:nucleotidyltransferase domain-containing protein [Oscillospiraceae bacterium]